MGQLDLSKKNWKAGRALLSLREQLDMDAAAHLSSYDRERVCVPQTCDCGREDCQYLSFLEKCSDGDFPFQICNHNLLLADTIHRGTGRNPILLDACWGHALVLFTSYAAMSAIKERLAEMNLPWTIFILGRNAVHTTQQFKDSPGSVLLATGAAWEGFDFPGNCVSLLIIPRLPFSYPDALKEKKRTEYADLRSFIRAVVVPEMQIKLKQGFGRAIRTETDTCVVAILDERAAPDQRHFDAMRAALPEMQVTNSLQDVVDFIYWAKDPRYFKEGKP